jgi:hypothetical protein
MVCSAEIYRDFVSGVLEKDFMMTENKTKYFFTGLTRIKS